MPGLRPDMLMSSLSLDVICRNVLVVVDRETVWRVKRGGRKTEGREEKTVSDEEKRKSTSNSDK
jgi:hypothetical protein